MVTLHEWKTIAAETGVQVHKSTISRALHKSNLHGRVARKEAPTEEMSPSGKFEFR